MKLKITSCHFLIFILLELLCIKSFSQNEVKYIPTINTELIDTIITDKGDVIIRVKVPGVPPKSHMVTKSTKVLPPSAVLLSAVPAFSWSFGCSPTAGAMMAGYYDRNGYPDMYTGPTNGGVCPLNNSSWGTDLINGEYRSLCPLSATKQGLDSRAERGHVDDYWLKYGSDLTDPYITNGWTEHEHEDCTADFMKTSQIKFDNSDGETSFYHMLGGAPFDQALEDDGAHGMKLFLESRGYTVKRWFSQTLKGYKGWEDGITYNDYKMEIDEGRPVIVHLAGHTILGVGYDSDSETIYFHNTWDYNVNSMTWGGKYDNMQMYSVSIFELEPNVICNIPTNLLFPEITGSSAELTWDLGLSNSDFEVSYGESGFNPAEGNLILVEDTNYVVLNNLLPETQYTCYVRMVCQENYSDWSQPISFMTDNTQIIALNTGWNIMSLSVMPENKDLLSIFQPLIDSGKLVKVQDESGNSLENLGIYGEWNNNIGDIALTEGYKVKLSGNDSIQIYGTTMANYPHAIPLKMGWNIIGYPQIETFSGLDVVQELIDRNTLIKVQDKAGNSIEDLGIFGDWTNNIGNFVAGYGYKIKVCAEDTLWISDTYSKSATVESARDMASHFIPAYKGNGTDHMNIYLLNPDELGFQYGDEIGIFDGNICVGSAKINLHSSTFNIQHSVSIPVSAADGNYSKNGYIAGNTITLKLYRNGAEYPLTIEPMNNAKPVFAKGETLLAMVGLATGVDNLATYEGAEINCYPNPFSNEITIEINLFKDTEVQLEVLNQLGQRVKFVTTKQLLAGGLHKLTWNGRNTNNQQVSPGIYHLYIGIDDEVYYRKIILSK